MFSLLEVSLRGRLIIEEGGNLGPYILDHLPASLHLRPYTSQEMGICSSDRFLAALAPSRYLACCVAVETKPFMVKTPHAIQYGKGGMNS